MPIYEFRCDACGHEFSEMMSIKQRERGRPPCPECGKKKVTQLISGFNAVTARKS